MDDREARDIAFAEALVEGEQHPVWGDHDRTILDKLEPRFVVTSWLWCSLAAVVLTALAAALIWLLTGDSPTSEESARFGLLGVVAGAGTFLGFALTMTARLERAPHDRLVNSLAVGALHVLASITLVLVELVVRSVSDHAITSTIYGGPLQQLGNAVFALERSSAAAMVGCLLAVGMVPAVGERPKGTQTASTPEDRQL